MRKKKTAVKKELTKEQIMNWKVLKALERVDLLDGKLNDLIRYVEYVANTVDLAISFSEFIGNKLSDNQHVQPVGHFGTTPSERLPTFLEYQEKRRKEAEAEIPF